MNVYDMAMNVLDTKWFPEHNIAGLISGITSIVLFQSGEASTVEGNKHTHTHSNHSNVIQKQQLAFNFVENSPVDGTYIWIFKSFKNIFEKRVCDIVKHI